MTELRDTRLSSPISDYKSYSRVAVSRKNRPGFVTLLAELQNDSQRISMGFHMKCHDDMFIFILHVFLACKLAH